MADVNDALADAAVLDLIAAAERLHSLESQAKILRS